MKEPRSDRETGVEGGADPPEFESLTPPEELVRGDRTRDDFFDAVLALDSPATASDVADIAGHGVDAAREYLEWFERLGIVARVTESPATYRRNQEYLDWRRVQRLRERYSDEELLAFLETESERADALRRQFDAESPTSISISGYASEADRSIEEVWEDISAWRTARRRVALLERALATGPGEAADRRTVV